MVDIAAAPPVDGELVSKAQSVLHQVGLPFAGVEGAQAATGAMAGAAFVSFLAQLAVRNKVLTTATGRIIEGLCGGAVEVYAAIVANEAPG